MREQLRPAVEATTIVLPDAAKWMDRSVCRLPSNLRDRLDDAAIRTFLVHRLANTLYANFYCTGTPVPPEFLIPELRASRTAFISRLAAANTGTGVWRAGGVIEGTDGTSTAVRWGRLRVFASPRELRSDAAAATPAAEHRGGEPVRLRFAAESLRASPGFYMALGNTDVPMGRRARWYWNVSPDGAAPLLAALTEHLNAQHVGFHFKVLGDPALYRRRDAGVLYCALADVERVAGAVHEVYRSVAGHLRDGVPALTLELARGLAVAADPTAGESFGMHRCEVVADGLVSAAEAGLTTVDECVEHVVACCESAGVRADRPYADPAAADLLDRVARQWPASRGRRTRRSGAGRSPDRSPDWLVVAHRMAQDIEKDALWYRDRCNWIGAETTWVGSRPRATWAPLPASLYSGTSGVGLFLAEIARQTGDASLERVAIGACLTALTGPVRSAEAGLYSGLLGAALAARRVGVLTGSEQLVARAERVAGQLARCRARRHDNDLLYGAAGRVLGLLAAEPWLGDDAAERATRLGRSLLRAAERGPRGWSWRASATMTTSATSNNPANLTGLSHGAAGVALALNELAAHTGVAEFAAAADEGVRYEDSYFDGDAGNWPDFRTTMVPQAATGRRRFATYWCHGAPGIALQRLRAVELTGSPTAAQDLDHACETTAAAVRGGLRSPNETFSICHGVLGNAEVIWDVGRRTGRPDFEELALEAAAEGVHRYASNGAWPCGTLIGDTPNLLLGRAGIGYFYLRLHDPAVPSILLFEPREWART